MWDLMRRIKALGNGPWLRISDFNEIMWQHKHFSASRRKKNKMRNFREALLNCNLHDQCYSGLPWTYDNKHDGFRNVKSRLAGLLLALHDQMLSQLHFSSIFHLFVLITSLFT
jgi:hypothetical protein